MTGEPPFVIFTFGHWTSFQKSFQVTFYSYSTIQQHRTSADGVIVSNVRRVINRTHRMLRVYLLCVHNVIEQNYQSNTSLGRHIFFFLLLLYHQSYYRL